MKALWVPAVIMTIAFPARAERVDCTKASTAVEKLICSEETLSELDMRVDRAYREWLGTRQVAERVKLDQQRWLAERNKCTDVACLTRSYQRRLVSLEPSFTAAPFISPRIINDLQTWLSDLGDQIVAINLTESQGSNRYYGDVKTRRIASGTYVYYQTPSSPGDEEFGYTHIGRTASGVDVLRTRYSGGGHGVFEGLLLVKLERSETGGELRSTGPNAETLAFKKPRLLIGKLGYIGLGDRWDGDIKITGDQLAIGKDRGPLTSEASWRQARVIKIEAAP
jgi:uncharacterized protein YecT (DUF1311 family)